MQLSLHESVVLSMIINSHHYEVFVDSVAGRGNGSAISTNWSWRRMETGGSTLVHGSVHGSLESCFASVRRHSATFGEAPIKVNLREPRS
jgi:hypothetical protein